MGWVPDDTGFISSFDCLLQAGALAVVGVDVGSAQLHPSLREDPRVLCVESVNARTLSAADLIAAYADSTGAEGQLHFGAAARRLGGVRAPVST